MGTRMVKFSFTPGENEQIETVIKLPEEHRSIIHGTVKDHCNRVVKDAIVKLYERVNSCDECCLKPLTHTFTDECGQFMFGPLWPCKRYAIKVLINDVKIRELVIYPDDFKHPSCKKKRNCACDWLENTYEEQYKEYCDNYGELDNDDCNQNDCCKSDDIDE